MTFEPRCKACRENSASIYFVYCAGCVMRKEYLARTKPEPTVCPEVKRETFPTSFPPAEPK